jgi:hypothetical protein
VVISGQPMIERYFKFLRAIASVEMKDSPIRYTPPKDFRMRFLILWYFLRRALNSPYEHLAYSNINSCSR